MKTKLTQSDIRFFKKTVARAGGKAASIQKSGIVVQRKDDRSIVTQADLIVQEYLIKKISRRLGPVNFIYEEGDRRQATLPHDSLTVIIDPIDGTAMFSMHLPIWCVSVGIFLGDEPLYGFVYAPGLDLFFHNDDTSAYLNGRPVRVNRRIIIDSETNIFYSTDIYKRLLIEFPGKARNLGSTALHACLVIDNDRNRTLAFIGKSMVWDWAGAAPIIMKAGGNLSYINGAPFRISEILGKGYALPDFLIAYTCDDFATMKKIFIPA